MANRREYPKHKIVAGRAAALPQIADAAMPAARIGVKRVSSGGARARIELQLGVLLRNVDAMHAARSRSCVAGGSN